MKKLISTILLVAAMVLAFALTASAATTTFYDVYSGDPNYTAIDYFRARNIAWGYTDGSYRPWNNMTRGDFIALVVRATGGTYQNTYNNYYYDENEPDYTGCFSDIKGKYYEDEVCYAKSQGWLDGFDSSFPSRKFSPKAKVSVTEAGRIVSEDFGVQNIYGSVGLNGSIARGDATRLVYQVSMDAIAMGRFSPVTYVDLNTYYSSNYSYNYTYQYPYTAPYTPQYSPPQNQYGSAYYPSYDYQYNNYGYQYGSASVLDSSNVQVPYGYPAPYRP
jgi:hypothetical protein